VADITITSANVVKGAGAVINRDRVAGETITAGQCVYRKASDDKWWRADSDTGTSAEADAQGIALHAASANQPLAVQTGGQITIGATIAAGVVYYVSNNAGGICPVGDLASADFVTAIGYGISTSVLVVNPVATGVQLA
jgi:hypothetical protein